MGILYGWIINPVEFSQIQPANLRSDFKADYVLMIAESFHQDNDLALAGKWLKPLGKKSTFVVTQDAVKTAQELGYSDGDVELMMDLSEALVQWSGEEVQNE
jgi:hypothetical protein